MAVLIAFNLIVALAALGLARSLWRLGRILSRFNQQIGRWQPNHDDLDFLEIAGLIRQGQTRVANLRQGYGQLQAGLDRWRQVVLLLSLMVQISGWTRSYAAGRQPWGQFKGERR